MNTMASNVFRNLLCEKNSEEKSEETLDTDQAGPSNETAGTYEVDMAGSGDQILRSHDEEVSHPSPTDQDWRELRHSMASLTKTMTSVVTELSKIKQRVEFTPTISNVALNVASAEAAQAMGPSGDPINNPYVQGSSTNNVDVYTNVNNASGTPAQARGQSQACDLTPQTWGQTPSPDGPPHVLVSNATDSSNDTRALPGTNMCSTAECFSILSGNDARIGPAINDNIRSLVHKFTAEKLPAGKVKEMEEKRATPQNLKLGVPQTNPEIWRTLSKAHQDRERRFQSLQATVTTGLLPLMETTEKLIKAVDEGQDIRHADAKEMLGAMVDALCLASTTHLSITQIRRQELKSVIPNRFHSLCETTKNPVDMDLLLGSDLNTKLKDLAEANKVSFNMTGRYAPYARPVSTGQYQQQRGHFLVNARGSWKDSRNRFGPLVTKKDNPQYHKKGRGGRQRRQ